MKTLLLQRLLHFAIFLKGGLCPGMFSLWLLLGKPLADRSYLIPKYPQIHIPAV